LFFSPHSVLEQGAELEVLNSINWSLVKFDVLCIETDPPNRPAGYAEKVAAFMKSKGYLDHAGQVGRNMCKYCAQLRNIRDGVIAVMSVT
jgi:hypothetical protein